MAAAMDSRRSNTVDLSVVNDEDEIDEEQLEEYREEVDQLGSFPVSVCSRESVFRRAFLTAIEFLWVKDKVKINSLSIIAGDHADSKSSAQAIYMIIRKRLLSTSRDNMLPLVYVLDSILKNVKGFYVDLAQDDAASWMPTVHDKLQDNQRAKLKKVWQTWNEFNLFSTDAWKAMGNCFSQTSGKSSAAGIPRSVRSLTIVFDSTQRLRFRPHLLSLVRRPFSPSTENWEPRAVCAVAYRNAEHP